MNDHALVVHSDPSTREALIAGLQGEGFEVQTASTGDEGWMTFQRFRPGLVISTTDVGEVAGVALSARVRKGGLNKNVSVVLLDSDRRPERRIRSIIEGADCWLSDASPVQNVLARARLWSVSWKKDGPTTSPSGPASFVCDLAEIGVLDLIALVHRMRWSGAAHLSGPGSATGVLFFEQGGLVDAEAGRVAGLEAFKRMLPWTSGKLQLESRQILRADVIGRPREDLAILGVRHLEEWTALIGRLAPADAVFRVALDLVIDRLSSSFGQLTEVLDACDGSRNVLQIVNECGLPDLDVLWALIRFRDEGLIFLDRRQEPRPTSDSPNVSSRSGGEPTLTAMPVTTTAQALVKSASLESVPSPPAGPAKSLPPAPSNERQLPVSTAEVRRLPAVTMAWPRMDTDPSGGAPIATESENGAGWPATSISAVSAEDAAPLRRPWWDRRPHARAGASESTSSPSLSWRPGWPNAAQPLSEMTAPLIRVDPRPPITSIENPNAYPLGRFIDGEIQRAEAHDGNSAPPRAATARRHVGLFLACGVLVLGALIVGGVVLAARSKAHPSLPASW